jgi:TetR/AcrR family transcriptional regulator
MRTIGVRPLTVNNANGTATRPRAVARPRKSTRVVPIKRDPERTRESILTAAVAEFAAKGLSGARVDQIAKRAGANKRMLYHYFGNKEALYLAVLEHVYEARRGTEQDLDFAHLEPEAAMRTLVEFNFAYCAAHPEFISLINNENLHGGKHLKMSRRVRDLHSPLIRSIKDILARGAAAGLFRRGVDAIELYISIAALNYFYFSNNATLSAIFSRDFRSRGEQDKRREHAADVILGYLRQSAG